jgi:Sortase domain
VAQRAEHTGGGWRGSRLLTAVCLALMAVGTVMAIVGKSALRWSPPPLPPASAAKVIAGGRLPARLARAGAMPMTRSVPVAVRIPRIGVRAKIISLGLDRTGGAAVPSLATPFLTGWFDRGVTPGQRGTAAIYGHVDAAKTGPAVFYRLGSLRPGDLVYVALQDRRIGTFKVYAVALYPKAGFPAAAVFRYTSWPTLRLITCGGPFDPVTHHYLGNIVVYASYVGQRPLPDEAAVAMAVRREGPG